MSQTREENRAGLEGDSYRELRVLEEVEQTSNLSQRRLANRIGVALGVANLLVKRLVKAGYVRASRNGVKKWVYVLTPAGIARKVQLTVDYVERFMSHYRKVRELVREQMKVVGVDEDSRVAIYGTTELGEFVFLALKELGVNQIDVFERGAAGGRFLGEEVRRPDSIVPQSYVKVIVVDRRDVETRCTELASLGVQTAQIVRVLEGSRDEVGVGV